MPAWRSRQDSLDNLRDLLWVESLRDSRLYAAVLWAVAVLAVTGTTALIMNFGSSAGIGTGHGVASVAASVGAVGVAACRRRIFDAIAARRRHCLVGAHPMCAACGYDLGALAAQADGCTVCPECGAAWRFN